ncbi:hypothetical protein NKR19_g9959 [Coniochaeta hoffmannii]|uniref:Uncharacterized protein n=1 Tax=Coniochaeta hoffmannii TaxID=91930 RepID=A0AA38R8D7_9PEZI|nr:hypothetical protein NKR19_g9959 [Coniochaeta hoffmannii]
MYNARKGIVADKIKSLGRILHRTDSSSHSTTASDLQNPLGGKERRRQARETYELHSQSVASSPLFNSPTSEYGPSSIGSPGAIFDPLLRAGTLLATAELDRLSFWAHSKVIDADTPGQEARATSNGTSPNVEVPPNTPATCRGTSTAATSPVLQTDGVLGVAVPANTPASDVATPSTPYVSHSTKSDHRRRGARSRLSEMYPPEDASEEIRDEARSESGSVVAASRARSSPGVSSAGPGVARLGRLDIHHNLVRKPLDLTPSPPEEGDRRAKVNSTAHVEGSEPKSEQKLDMEHLNELLDNAIGNSIAVQRLDTATSASLRPAGTQLLGPSTVCSPSPHQMKRLGDGTHPSQSLTSSSVASPIGRKYMAKHFSKSTSPTASPSAPFMPNEWYPDGGGEPGDSGVFRPVTMSDTVAHEQRTDSKAKGKRANVRRSTSGTVQVTEMAESSDGTSTGTESSDSEAPLADDGCPHEFARLQALREQLTYSMPDTMPEGSGKAQC